MSTRFQDPAGRWSSLASVPAVLSVCHPAIHLRLPAAHTPVARQTLGRAALENLGWMGVAQCAGRIALQRAVATQPGPPQLRTRPVPRPHLRFTFLAHRERGRKCRRIRAGKANTRPAEPLRISDR